MVLIAALSILLRDTTYGPVVDQCTVKIPAITECSGICMSPKREGIWYCHNDSGDSPRFFAMKADGSLEKEYAVQGGKAIDWEDCASAMVDGKSYIYFADFGDNELKREDITIYQVEEPSPSQTTPAGYYPWTLKYPDGPHNAEALMVEPKSGTMWIVTKEDVGPARLYTTPKGMSTDSTQKLAFRGTIEFKEVGPYANQVTGGDIAPDGNHIVLRTYRNAYEWDTRSGMRNWWRNSPNPVRLPIEPQGEAICYSQYGDALLTASEGTTFVVHKIAIHR